MNYHRRVLCVLNYLMLLRLIIITLNEFNYIFSTCTLLILYYSAAPYRKWLGNIRTNFVINTVSRASHTMCILSPTSTIKLLPSLVLHMGSYQYSTHESSL